MLSASSKTPDSSNSSVLLQGLDPRTGEQLTARSSSTAASAGWDVTAPSIPKGVTVALERGQRADS